MVRLLLSLVVGAVITFFLYVLMAFLIGGDDTFTNAKKDQIVIEINSTPPESKAQTRVRVPPPPPPPPPEPPKAPHSVPAQQIVSTERRDRDSAYALNVSQGATCATDTLCAIDCTQLNRFC